MCDMTMLELEPHKKKNKECLNFSLEIVQMITPASNTEVLTKREKKAGEYLSRVFASLHATLDVSWYRHDDVSMLFA